MLHSHKILLNTLALYFKIVINVIVQLVATRIALKALGVEAFGLYNLIAGLIILLSFFNGALIISTQRFMSIALGKKEELELTKIFNVSLFIHLLFSIALFVILKILQPFLFIDFLSIPPLLYDTSIRIYNLMIISSFITIFSIPYSANINAREDMWFFALSEILTSIFKLFAAVSLLFIRNDLLYYYTLFMLFAILIGAITKVIWCTIKYRESHISIKLMRDKVLLKKMFGFMSWNTLGSSAVLVRNQGVAVLLNVFFGTAVNAAYGIANQVNSLVLTFASTLTTVFTPTIIQSHGEGDNIKMLFIAKFASKTSFFLSSVVALPLLVYMPIVLELWLDDVPNYTVVFCRLIVVAFIILQVYPGLNRAIYATGSIKGYQVITSLLLVLIIPAGVFLFRNGYPAYSIMGTMVFLQLCVLISTLYFAKKQLKLDVREFSINSVIRPFLIFSIILGCEYLIDYYAFSPATIVELFFVSIFFMLLYTVLYYKVVFNKKEKEKMVLLYHSLVMKVKKEK